MGKDAHLLRNQRYRLLNRTELGAAGQNAREKKCALKDKAGGSCVLGIVDNGG